ncbi:MAG: NTP transferase domain-containing protein [bacterium]
MSPPFVSAILLAAGTSNRMGKGKKLLLRIGQKSLLRWSLQHVLDCRANEIILVVGEDADEIERCANHPKVRLIRNLDYREGMSASIRVGVEAVSPHADGVLILLADQPTLRTETLDRFLQAFAESGKRIVSAHYAGVTGNPVLFHRDFFDDLTRLQGDLGARALLAKYANEVATVPLCEDEALDVDTPEDLERAKKILSR